MKIKLIMFLVLLSFCSSVADKEKIHFKFQLEQLHYLGIGEVSDAEDQLSYTITLLEKVGENDVALQDSNALLCELATKFSGDDPLAKVDDLSSGEVAPTLIPNDPFKNNGVAWVKIYFSKAHPADDNASLTLGFRRCQPQFCIFKVTLNGVDYHGAAEVVADRDAVSYFVPRTAFCSNPDSEIEVHNFTDNLQKNNSTQQPSAFICNTPAQRDSLDENDVWLEINVHNITSAKYPRVFYTHSLGSTQIKIVDFDAQDLPGEVVSVNVSQIGPPNTEQLTFLSIPLNWSGFLSISYDSATTVAEKLKLPNKMGLISIGGKWWHVKNTNEKQFRPLTLQFVAIIVPSESKNMVLRLRHKTDTKAQDYFGYVLENGVSAVDPTLLCIKVRRFANSPNTHLEIARPYSNGNKFLFDINDQDKHATAVAHQSFDSDAFKTEGLNWNPIYIAGGDYFKEIDYVIFYYQKPKSDKVNFRLVASSAKLPIYGTVLVGRIENPTQTNSTAGIPRGWEGQLSLTGFDPTEREKIEQLVYQDSSYFSISYNKGGDWWLLKTKKERLSWSLDSLCVGNIAGRNHEMTVVMIKRWGTDYFGFVTEDPNKKNLILNIKKIKNTEQKLLDLHRFHPKGNTPMYRELTKADIESAALTKVFDREPFARHGEYLEWSPIHIDLLEDNGDEMKMTYIKPMELKVEVLVVDDLSIPIEAKIEKNHHSARILSYKSLDEKSIEFKSSEEKTTCNTKLLELIEPNNFPEIKINVYGSCNVKMFVKSSNSQYLRFNISSKHLGTGIKLGGEFEYTVETQVEFKIKDSDTTEITGMVMVMRARDSTQDKLPAHAPAGWTSDLSLTKFTSGEKIIDANNIFKTYTKAQITICIDNFRWLLEKQEKNLTWCLDNSFIATVVAKEMEVPVWVLMVRKGQHEYYKYLSEQPDAVLKVEAGDQSCHLYKNNPDARESSLLIIQRNKEEVVKELYFSAIGLQKFQYKSFRTDKLDWDQIFIESIEFTEDGNIAIMNYAKQEQHRVRFHLVGTTTKGDVTVLKSKSDKLKFSDDVAPNGWKGRLNLVAFDNVDGPQEVEEALKMSNAQFYIILKNEYYLLKLDKLAMPLIQGTIDAKLVNNQILAITVGEKNYFGLVVEEKETDDLYTLKVQTNAEKLARFVDGAQKNNKNNLLNSEIQLQDIKHASMATQIWERGSFTLTKFTKLDWSPIWIESLVPMPDTKFIVMTYRKHKLDEVFVLFEGLLERERTPPPNKVKIRSRYAANEIAVQEVRNDLPGPEVILEWGPNQAYEAALIIGEQAQAQMFLRHKNANDVTGWHRIVLTSYHMNSNIFLTGKIQPLQFPLPILFWIRSRTEDDKTISVYLLDGLLLDETSTKITFVGGTQSRPHISTNTDPDLVNWRECLRTEESRKLYTFGMHRHTTKFRRNTGVDLTVTGSNLANHVVARTFGSLMPGKEPVVIDCKFKTGK